MKPFETRVLEIVSRIPRGKVTTYGLIARAAGMPSVGTHGRMDFKPSKI